MNRLFRKRRISKKENGEPIHPAALAVALALVATLVVSGLSRDHQPTIDLPAKITLLTENLNKSAETIAEIERDIQQRHELVTKLQRDAEIAERVSKLNREQVDAIAQTLQGELEKRERNSFWWTFAYNLFFVLLGVVLTELWHWIRRRHLANSPLTGS